MWFYLEIGPCSCNEFNDLKMVSLGLECVLNPWIDVFIRRGEETDTHKEKKAMQRWRRGSPIPHRSYLGTSRPVQTYSSGKGRCTSVQTEIFKSSQRLRMELTNWLSCLILLTKINPRRGKNIPSPLVRVTSKFHGKVYKYKEICWNRPIMQLT